MIALLFSGLLVPVNLETVSLERAQRLDGKLVVASFVSVKPPYTLGGKTMLGASDRPEDGDVIERNAVLRGRHLELEGRQVHVIGRLRVLNHRADFVGGVLVPAWSEIRVEQ